MTRAASRPGVAAALAGGVMLADLVLLRWFMTGDAEGVRLLGRPLGIECAVRARWGVPCPTCGITRGVVLAVHGEWVAAWQIAPGAPVAVAGMALLAVALLGVGALESTGRGDAAVRWVRRAAVVWAGVTGVVWIGGWLAALAAAVRG